MNWKARSSRSVYKAILQVGQQEPEYEGLTVTDRYFIPKEEPKTNLLLWILMDAAVLGGLTEGLLWLIASGFDLNLHPAVYLVPLLECLAVMFLFRSRYCHRHEKIWMPAAVVLTLFYLFLLQRPFLAGASRFVYQITLRVNEVYDGKLSAAETFVDSFSMGVFLGFVTWLILLWLGMAILRKNRFSYVCLLLFPLLAVTALFGGARSYGALFLLFFGLMLALSYQYPVRRSRMMGKGKKGLYEKNQKRFESIQKKSAVLVLAGSMILSISGYFLIRPFLAWSLAPAEKKAVEIQNTILGKAITFLPDVTGGVYSLQVETVGGGVLDGSLTDTEGYTFQDMEDLSVTISDKPGERLYLKGFVGSNYDGSSWQEPYESSFTAAAMNWRTEGEASLYIQNLPFLRTAFVLQQENSTDEPMQITVERINANDAYTYVPYGAFLNDYYEVMAGDGAVKGQDLAADQYLMYESDYRSSLLNTWNAREDTANMLDRVEESYRAYCSTQYLTVAEGLKELQLEVDAVKKERNWDPSENLDDITGWIRAYLAENYTFEMKTQTLAEGEDFLTSFLFDTKQGYSIHFASAAVELYRMFGVPARYVVGYVAPVSLFAVQTDGSYHAVLEDDNSQAWAEVYADGIGWLPRDMTPGVIGTLEEVGGDGERISSYEEETVESEETALESEKDALSDTDPDKMEKKTDSYGVGQIIQGIILLLSSILLVTAAYRLYRRLCFTRGYDPFGRRGTKRAALGIFESICQRLHRLGLPEDVDSESEEFIRFANEQLKRNDRYREGDIEKAVDRIYRCCYGEDTFQHEDVLMLRKLYRMLPGRKEKSQ